MYYSRLASDCASVDFNIVVDNLTATKGSHFRITVDSDLNISKSKNYSILVSINQRLVFLHNYINQSNPGVICE